MGAHDTTVISTPSYGLAKIGYGLTGGVLQIGGDVSSASGTMEAWVNTTHTGVIGVVVGNSGSQIWLGKDTNGKAAFGRPGLAVSSTVTINDGVWHHLALTVSGTVFTLWVDGVSVATSTYTSTMSLPTSTRIGHYGTNATFPWVGSIDEVRISNSLRYTAGFTPAASAFTVDANTTALFHLDSSGADEVPDTTPPTVPTGLTTTPGIGTLLVSWTASTDSSGSPSYEIYRATSSPVPLTSPFATVPAGTTQYQDIAVSNPTTYYYAIKAVDSSGNKSAGSAEVSGVPNAGATAQFAPNNAALVFSPFNWDITAVRAKTINPGAYLRFAVAGSPSKVTLNFDTTSLSSPYPILKYRVDDGGWQSVTLSATLDISWPSTNTWTEHTIEVVVQATSEFVTRWTPQNAHVSLTSITATGTTAPTLAPVTAADRKMLIFGDSIAEGYKTLKNVTTPDGSDATVGWAYMLGRMLGVEAGVVGFGGQAWLAGGQGGVPALPTSYNVLWGGGPSRSFNSPTPDIILIEMGHNDGLADVAGVTTAAQGMINALLALVSVNTRIYVLLPFSGRQKAPLQAAVANIGKSRVQFIDSTGWWTTADALDGTHPTGSINTRALAPKVAARIRAQEGGDYINVGGVAKRIKPTTV